MGHYNKKPGLFTPAYKSRSSRLIFSSNVSRSFDPSTSFAVEAREPNFESIAMEGFEPPTCKALTCPAALPLSYIANHDGDFSVSALAIPSALGIFVRRAPYPSLRTRLVICSPGAKSGAGNLPARVSMVGLSCFISTTGIGLFNEIRLSLPVRL